MRREWRTRKKGTASQIGTKFPVLPRGDKRDLPRNLRIVSIPEYSELNRSLKEEIEETKEHLEEPNQ